MSCCDSSVSKLSKFKAFLTGPKKIKGEDFTLSKRIALIGNPNVGKSVIFNSLTGAYVTVSNYPGTTVEVSRGWYSSDDIRFEIIDTPGMYSLMPITEEERVTRNLLFNEKPDLIVHIIDAKNIGRMLPLTLQLIEAGFPVMLVLNIMDEAKTLGIEINCTELQKLLGIQVITASATLNMGIGEIRESIKEHIKNAA